MDPCAILLCSGTSQHPKFHLLFCQRGSTARLCQLHLTKPLSSQKYICSLIFFFFSPGICEIVLNTVCGKERWQRRSAGFTTVRIPFMQESRESLEPVCSVLINAAGLCRKCLSSWECQGLYGSIWKSRHKLPLPIRQRLEAHALTESPTISQGLITPAWA